MVNVIDMFFMVVDAAKRNAPITDPLNDVRHPLNDATHPLRSAIHPMKLVTHPLNGINVSSLERIRALQEMLDQHFPRN